MYLIGGADASAPHEILPVYTPAALQDGTLLAWNMTLPLGYFSAPPEDGQQQNGVPLLSKLTASQRDAEGVQILLLHAFQ